MSGSLSTPDYNLSDFAVHGISQARILEWVAISFSRGSSWPMDQFCVSCIAGESLPLSQQGRPYLYLCLHHMDIDIKDLLWRIGSYNYGDRDTHSLPSEGCRPRKAGIVIQFKYKDLRTRGASGVNPSLRVRDKHEKRRDDMMRCDEMRWPSSTSERGKRGEFFFLHVLMYSGPQGIWCSPRWGRQSMIQMLISSGSILTDIPRNIVFG